MNKLLILTALTLQNAAHILTVRYTRAQTGELALTSSIVTACEVLKMTTCLLILIYQNGFRPGRFLSQLKNDCFSDMGDFARLMVPGLLYTFQNNLLFVSLSNLPAATYQVLYQLKLLTTAMFSYLMLGKKFSPVQWASLLVLFLGLALVESDKSEEKSVSRDDQNQVLGLVTVILSSISSGFAGVWFERIIKGSSTKPKSIWCANVQLASIGIVMGYLTGQYYDGKAIAERGFFQGFSTAVWMAVILQGLGGLLVSMVVKYADSILKAFACAAAILVGCVGAMFLFDFQISIQFVLGTVAVVGAIVMYSSTPPVAQKPKET